MATKKNSTQQRSKADVARDAIGAVERTQMTALGRAPEQHVATLQIAVVAVVLFTVVGGCLIYKDQPVLGSLALAAAMVPVVAAMFFLRPVRSAPSTVNDQAEPPRHPEWSRVTVKTPLPPESAIQLADSLARIRTGAQARYRELLEARSRAGATADAAIDANNVRVNVFLPDSQNAKQGEVCGMHIPEHLHHGMFEADERTIRFRPNEGLTGRVFTLQRAFGALRQAADAEWQLIMLQREGERGDGTFHLTVRQINLINPDLRWIVGFPLQASVQDNVHTFGVLNIDGLIEPLSAQEMLDVFNHLQGDVQRFSREAWTTLQKTRISISVEDVQT